MTRKKFCVFKNLYIYTLPKVRLSTPPVNLEMHWNVEKWRNMYSLNSVRTLLGDKFGSGAWLEESTFKF